MYLFTFSLLGLFAFLDVSEKIKKHRTFLLITALLWLVFHDGLRWGVGTDWEIYYQYFESCLSQPYEQFEIGYRLLNIAIRSITNYYTIFLLIHATLVYYLIGKSVNLYSVSPLFTIFIFYFLMLSFLGMNRQYIAFAIAIFSYRYILSNKLIPFAICIIIGFLFHNSILIFVLAYFMNRRIRFNWLLIIFLSSLVISISGIINKLPLNLFYLLGSTTGEKLQFFYENNFLQTNIFFTLLSLLKRSIWLILGLLYYKKYETKSEYFHFFFNLYFLATCIYIIFNGTVLQIIVGRGLMYYSIAEIFLIPIIIMNFSKSFSRNFIVCLIIVNGWIQIEKGFNFYKKDLRVDIFRPYNSVLINSDYNAMEDNKHE